ncbi:DUF4225 domain-containing protein [Pseudomonas cichorii]|uniref:DUF4225 domain-containing protein n=1 Tax=Pseudomonas cichorii TaxID=36746 RepID=UPI00217F885C|nr:DUF4225 domain-containing protein [Pseudomonas cichorii]
MSTKETSKSHELWKVSEAASLLAGQACTVSARHINDGMLRLQFNREVAYYATSIIRDVERGDKTIEQGMKAIKDEQEGLLSQSYAIFKKSVGTIAGSLQVAGGVGVCYGSIGTLCVVFGLPLIAHGANNVYENGRNLITGRTDTEGPLRKGYQTLSKRVGSSEFEGNMVYGSVDLLLSGYGAGRLILKPDAWRLFRYIRTDHIRAYQNTSLKVFATERGGDVLTIESMYDQWKAHENE